MHFVPDLCNKQIYWVSCIGRYLQRSRGLLKAIIEDVLVHLDHRRAVLGRLRVCPCIKQDVIDNPLACFSRCDL